MAYDIAYYETELRDDSRLGGTSLACRNDAYCKLFR